MVAQKGNARVPQCMAENDFIKGPSYNTADPSTDHKEGASLIKQKPALFNKAKDQLKEKTKNNEKYTKLEVIYHQKRIKTLKLMILWHVCKIIYI